MRKIIKLSKDFLLFTRIFILAKPFQKLFKTISNLSSLTAWIMQVNKQALIINDFYTPQRIHGKRMKLYEAVGTKLDLDKSKINYLEFGVASGVSFKWWLSFNAHRESAFYGFDTFEGLPEDWGLYKKGEMNYSTPDMNDPRARLMKGLFQQTLIPFLDAHQLNSPDSVTVVHLDADLFTATIFVLTQIYKHLKTGDVIFFDEFSVPNHEYDAYKIFIQSFGITLQPLGAVNNFYQVAFLVK